MNLTRLTGGQIAQPLEILGTLDGALDQHITAIPLVTPAGNQSKNSHRVQRPRYYRFRYIQMRCQSANRVRRRFQINGQQNGHLPGCQVGIIAPDLSQRGALPQAK